MLSDTKSKNGNVKSKQRQFHRPFPDVQRWYNGPIQPIELGHDKMVFCLVAAQASIFKTPHQAFFLSKSAHEAFSALFVSFYQQTFLATFYLILSFINKNFNVKNS